ncbi:MAG: hypothetical protein LUE98_14500 [Tannerellaceae bacterium]|nr:hypothetical protein [Tannerellaceae bacterium]
MKIEDIKVCIKVELLNNQRMKSIVDGYKGGDGKCVWSDHWAIPVSGCTNSTKYAEFRAGENGWWCCNCEEAIKNCFDLDSPR